MEALTYPAAGAKTVIGGSTSANISTSSKARGFVFAGAGSSGLVVGGAAQSPNIQFGTSSTDTLANTSVTAQVADQEGGSAPSLVETDADGSQSLGYGRVKWNATTKHLEMYHGADDALVSSSPRVQLYTNRVQHATVYHRVFLAFSLGTPTVPWMEYSETDGLNSALIFQIKNDANEPSLTLDVMTGSDASTRDLVMTYRDTAGSDPVNVARVSDIRVGFEHTTYCIVDLFLDWRSSASGGKPMAAWWCNGSQVLIDGGERFREPNVYSTSTTISRPMVGIYRYTRSAKAPDPCGITFKTFRVEQSLSEPSLNGSYEAFNMPGRAWA